jgi:competence protein ComEA
MNKLKKFSYVAIWMLSMPLVAYAGPVNVNTADAQTISAELKGVGITKALAIVDYRKANGPFKSVEDLILVKGIGERTIEINRANIILTSSDEPRKK